MKVERNDEEGNSRNGDVEKTGSVRCTQLTL